MSARDEPEAAISPAMDGILKVHRRIIEGSEIEGEGAVQHPPFAVVSSKLLVAATQAGNLIGRQGATIKVIQDAAGANVRVLSVGKNLILTNLLIWLSLILYLISSLS